MEPAPPLRVAVSSIRATAPQPPTAIALPSSAIVPANEAEGHGTICAPGSSRRSHTLRGNVYSGGASSWNARSRTMRPASPRSTPSSITQPASKRSTTGGASAGNSATHPWANDGDPSAGVTVSWCTHPPRPVVLSVRVAYQTSSRP